MPNWGNWFTACEVSSIVGVQYWVNGYNFFHKLGWVAVVFVCSFFGFRMCYNNIINWQENPASSTVSKTTVDQLVFPAVTVCPYAPTPWLAYQNIMNQIEVNSNLTENLAETLSWVSKNSLSVTNVSYKQADTISNFLDTLPPKPGDSSLYFPEEMFSYEEWTYKLDQHFMENCTAGGKYCGFHYSVLGALQAKTQDPNYENWENDQFPEDTTVTPTMSVLNLYDTITNEFMGNIEPNGKDSSTLIDEYIAFLKKWKTEEDQEEVTTPETTTESSTESLTESSTDPTTEASSIGSKFFGNKTDNIYNMVLEETIEFLKESMRVLTLLANDNTTCRSSDEYSNYKEYVESLPEIEFSAYSITFLLDVWKSFKETHVSPAAFKDKTDGLVEKLKAESPLCNSTNLQLRASQLLSYGNTSISAWQVMKYPDGIAYPGNDSDTTTLCKPEVDSEEFTCSCKCEKQIKMKILKLYLTLTVYMFENKEILYLGEILAYTIQQKLIIDHEYEAFPQYDETEKNISKEISDLESDVLNNVLGIPANMTLHDFINIMTIIPDFLSNGYDFPKLVSWPPEARNEIFSLYNYNMTAMFAGTQKLVHPTFDNISGNGKLADICKTNTGPLKTYCHIIDEPLELETIMEIMKNAWNPIRYEGPAIDFFSGSKYNSNFTGKKYPLASSIPFCAYGEDTDIYLRIPDISLDKLDFGMTLQKYEDELQLSNETVYRFPACKDFRPMPSDIDLCQTFNGLYVGKIFEKTQWTDTFKQVFYYGLDEPETVQNVTASGVNWGLTFILDTLQSFKISKVRRRNGQIDTNKFWMKLHDPGEIPRLGNEDPATWTLIEHTNQNAIANIQIKIDGEFAEATPDFRNIPIESRKCLFPDEGNLELIKHYTKTNCLMECHWKKATEICGCKPWNIPAKDGEKTCFFLGNQCFIQIMVEMSWSYGSIKASCNCPNDCLINDYSMEVSTNQSPEEIISMCKTDSDGCWEDFMNSYYTTSPVSTAKDKTRKSLRWLNLADYILDRNNSIHPSEAYLASEDRLKVYPSDPPTNQLLKRMGNFFIVSVSLKDQVKKISKTKLDVIMSTDDKIAWIGGTIGGFNGFCIISGVEIIYWLLMILFGYKSSRVFPADELNCGNCGNRVKELEKNLEMLAMRIKNIEPRTHSSGSSGNAFDVIFSPEEEP